MSAFNPFAVIEGGLQAGKEYREGRAMDDILKQSRQAKSPEDQLNIMGQVLQRLPADKRAEANEYLKERYRLTQLQGRQDEIKNPRGPRPGTSPGTPQPIPASQSPDEASQAAPQPQRTEQKQGFDFRKGDPESLAKRASELYNERPSYYFEQPNQARLDAKAEYDDQQIELSKAEKGFNETVQSYLGNEDYNDLKGAIGEMKEKYLQQAKEAVAKGELSAEKAYQKAGKDLLDFAKTRTNLGAISTGNIFSSKGPQRARDSLQAARRAYKDRNELELFENDLVNKQGLSTGVAATVAYPISENRDVDQFLKDTKNKGTLNPLRGSIPQRYLTGLKETGKGGSSKRTERGMAEYIGNHLGDSSIQAIATKVNAKGYDADVFLNDLQDLWDKGHIYLNNRQVRDLQKRTGYGATLKDIAFFSETGLNPKEITL